MILDSSWLSWEIGKMTQIKLILSTNSRHLEMYLMFASWEITTLCAPYDCQLFTLLSVLLGLIRPVLGKILCYYVPLASASLTSGVLASNAASAASASGLGGLSPSKVNKCPSTPLAAISSTHSLDPAADRTQRNAASCRAGRDRAESRPNIKPNWPMHWISTPVKVLLRLIFVVQWAKNFKYHIVYYVQCKTLNNVHTILTTAVVYIG